MDHVGCLPSWFLYYFSNCDALNARKTITIQFGSFFVVGCAVGIGFRRWFQKDALNDFYHENQLETLEMTLGSTTGSLRIYPPPHGLGNK